MKHQLLSILKIKRDINEQVPKIIVNLDFQIWRIFTHLKLWIASARHNFKWVKIPIE